MVRTLKNRRRSRYQFDKNRKNLKKKLKIKSGGKIKCPEIRREIVRGKSLKQNINEMGLVFNTKREFKVPSFKDDRTRKLLSNGFVEESVSDTEESVPKQHVASKFEKEAKELRESKFKLPKSQIKMISYYMDKYGLNYKQMVKDHKNFDQLTWRQFRQKIRKFMSIPEQFALYLEERNLVETEIDPSDPKWQETNTDIEDEN